jgi:hypothetical protein
MSLRTEYDVWHDKNHELSPSYDDTSSPWYTWVRAAIGEVHGLRTLEVDAAGLSELSPAMARKPSGSIFPWQLYE